MPERIAAEGSRAVFRIFEDLFAFGPECLDPLQGGLQIVYVEIEVHWAPMPLVVAPVFGSR